MVQPHNQLLAQISGHLSGLGTPVSGGVDATVKASDIISQVIGVLTVFAFIWFGIQIILAGYSFITAEGDPKKMEVARKRLTDGVLGATIVVTALGLGSLIATLSGISNVFDLGSLFKNIGL